MPAYPRPSSSAWGALMETYFAMGLLTLGIQIVDIRHKPTATI